MANNYTIAGDLAELANAAALPATVRHGVVTVTTAGTRVALAGAATLLSSGITVTALVGNTGIIYLGGSGVTSVNGYRLGAGESVFVESADLNSVYVDASINAQGAMYIGG